MTAEIKELKPARSDTTPGKLLAHVPKLDPVTRSHCVRREARYPYFEQGYVDLNLGRSIQYTEAIARATEGHAVADEQGNVLKTYKLRSNADKAYAVMAPVAVTAASYDFPEEAE